MAEYYLISQLPSLDGVGENTPLPITEERFQELCNRYLGKKMQKAIEELTISPDREMVKTGFSLIDAWNKSEQDLRFALGKIRAEKMKKVFDTENRLLPLEYIKAAKEATELENPLKAEQYLNQYRLQILETLRPMDGFSEDYLFYYGLKLKLLLRVRRFDSSVGEKAYRDIYNSILNGDRSEGKQ